MGVLPILVWFIVIVIALTAIVVWLFRRDNKLERRIKRLEEAVFDGPVNRKR